MQDNEPIRPEVSIKEIRLTTAEQERFAKAVLDPPPVAPALRRAMKNRERLLDRS